MGEHAQIEESDVVRKVINTRYSVGRALVAWGTKEAKVALFPYSWIGFFRKDFPFTSIIPISFSDAKLSLVSPSPAPPLPSFISIYAVAYSHK